jgi:hypothetical protein
MSTQRWSKVELTGEGQAIPRTCPNCLKPSEVENRYSYTRPFPIYLLDRTRYWQTFYYCSSCARTLDAFFKHQRIKGWLWFPAGAAFIGALIGSAMLFSKGGPFERLKDSDAMVPIMIGADLLLVIALFWGISSMIKRFIKGRHPQQADQATWGPAAYFVGSWLGLGNAKGYIAARPEWIRALVESNRDQVDDATYQRIVGAPKPAVEAKRPFA